MLQPTNAAHQRMRDVLSDTHIHTSTHSCIRTSTTSRWPRWHRPGYRLPAVSGPPAWRPFLRRRRPSRPCAPEPAAPAVDGAALGEKGQRLRTTCAHARGGKC
eukprot:365848-Chlamydomonas_euryale.AAC.4